MTITTKNLVNRKTNALAEYKLTSYQTWTALASLSGLTVQTLIKIANTPEQELREKINMKTFLIIKEKLGVELFKI